MYVLQYIILSILPLLLPLLISLILPWIIWRQFISPHLIITFENKETSLEDEINCYRLRISNNGGSEAKACRVTIQFNNKPFISKWDNIKDIDENAQGPSIEIHPSELFHPRKEGPFGSLNQDELNKLAEDIANVISGLEISIISVVLEKRPTIIQLAKSERVKGKKLCIRDP